MTRIIIIAILGIFAIGLAVLLQLSFDEPEPATPVADQATPAQSNEEDVVPATGQASDTASSDASDTGVEAEVSETSQSSEPIPSAGTATSQSTAETLETDVQTDPAGGDEASNTDEQTSQIAALPESASENETGTDSEPAAKAEPILPTFDVVRINPSGDAVVAGKAAPGANVSVMADGEVMGETTADDRGEWVILPNASLSPGTHQIGLRAVSPDGVETVSEKLVVVVVAEPVPQEETKPLAVLIPRSETGPSTILQSPDLDPLETPETPETAKPEAVEGEADSTTSPSAVASLPATVSLDVIDYGDDGSLSLGGVGEPGQTVRAYLNNQIMTDALVDDTGRWQMIPDAPVDPGLYRLRIDQLDALGKVTSRVETPFERAEPKIVADIVAQTQAQEAASDSATATSDTAVEQSRVQLESASEAAEALAAAASQAVNGAPVDGASEDADGTPADSGTNQLASRESARTSADTASASSESVSEETTPRRPTTVTIVPGNNLWTIARETYGDGIAYTVIFRANSDQIRDPDLIYPGQVFALPSRENPPAE